MREAVEEDRDLNRTCLGNGKSVERKEERATVPRVLTGCSQNQWVLLFLLVVSRLCLASRVTQMESLTGYVLNRFDWIYQGMYGPFNWIPDATGFYHNNTIVLGASVALYLPVIFGIQVRLSLRYPPSPPSNWANFSHSEVSSYWPPLDFLYITIHAWTLFRVILPVVPKFVTEQGCTVRTHRARAQLCSLGFPHSCPCFLMP